ncbi:MAG: hypothetical protein PHP50_01835 [Lachnospiraceae bacterium]|nr:hypothetical protein [Lachnospiraceae bacterium]
MDKFIKLIGKVPILSSFIVAMWVGLVLGFVVSPINNVIRGTDYTYTITDLLIVGCFTGIFIIYPFVLTVINLLSLFFRLKSPIWTKAMKKIEYTTVILGSIFSVFYTILTEIRFEATWDQTLYNAELHQPVWTEGVASVVLLSVVGAVGYMMLSWIRLDKMPPLLIVCAIAAMYLGIYECGMWCIQMLGKESSELVLCVFPFNCILIAMKTIRYKICEWTELQQKQEQQLQLESEPPQNSVIAKWNQKLSRAVYWPVAAFIIMWPLLGILLCILILFGQRPDTIIKAWTETADWKLSQRIPPQNIMRDEHYLCTVAAGGHEEVVKPIRMGERHGHRVVVNRQLCIANAFEEVIQERTPHFHKVVRHVYDTCGFPIAKLIRSKTACDVVYYIMKPLEWFFLAVLYLVDVKPENRIAVQYLPKMKKEEM